MEISPSFLLSLVLWHRLSALLVIIRYLRQARSSLVHALPGPKARIQILLPFLLPSFLCVRITIRRLVYPPHHSERSPIAQRSNTGTGNRFGYRYPGYSAVHCIS
ncbi:hypothetical protein HOY80DRAFT_771247 [Tuber brumale]|nr:hypothetical protein HOY80DRAFT_771247 [Tuber brumale]